MRQTLEKLKSDKDAPKPTDHVADGAHACPCPVAAPARVSSSLLSASCAGFDRRILERQEEEERERQERKARKRDKQVRSDSSHSVCVSLDSAQRHCWSWLPCSPCCCCCCSYCSRRSPAGLLLTALLPPIESIVLQKAAESEDEYEEDPDMALAMGFGGFAGGVHA